MIFEHASPGQADGSVGDDSATEPLTEAGRYASDAAAHERGLVALASGSAYWLEHDADGCRLLVPAGEAERVRGQLELFERENADWSPRRPSGSAEQTGRFADGLFVACCWAVAEIACYAAQERWPAVVEAGAVDARAIFSGGEIWRAATALFLHADAQHIASNLASGLFLFATVFALFGRLRGGLLLAGSAVAGNLASAAIHWPGDYRSIGASTAVFAGLGLLTGRATRRAVDGMRGGRSVGHAWFPPLAAGLTVLGLFGAGEQRVDVLAHATGFVAGLIAGLVAGGGKTAIRETGSIA